MEVAVRGTEQERETFKDVITHLHLALEDQDNRRPTWDQTDELFRSSIPDDGSWPYRAQVFDPRTFTAVFEKTSRLIGKKPKGRLVPREGGDVLGAKINNEMLDFQWNESARIENDPMIAKWAQMDMNARKYGASFGIAKWRYETRMLEKEDKKGKKQKAKVCVYDGPTFRVLSNRDCLPNPSYSTIKNWFQVREYVTLQELEQVNDTGSGKPIYKNLDILRDSVKSESKDDGGDSRDISWISKNKEISGVVDTLGRDPSFKVVEVVTEYQNDRWITFTPNHGLILRDIENPYHHGQIPIVMLRYYPIDDDLYGLSELEPVEKLQRAINALLCQYLDAVNTDLYPPIILDPTRIRMQTVEFGPNKKWIVSGDPRTAVYRMETSTAATQQFNSTYTVLVSSMMNALGQSSMGVSNIDPFQTDKTATEVRSNELNKNVRDNFNQIFLGMALEHQMQLWFLMNKQFIFENPAKKYHVIRVVGKDALKYFQTQELDAVGLTSEQAVELMDNPQGLTPEDEEMLNTTPHYPVQVGKELKPKMVMDESGQAAELYLEPEDMSGNYDYIADVGSMETSNRDQETKQKYEAIMLATGMNPKTGQPSGVSLALQQEGVKIKIKDLLIDYFEDMGFKDADQYFESLPEQPAGGMYGQEANGQVVPGGAGIPQAGVAPAGNGGVSRIPAGVQAVPRGTAV